MGTQGKPTLPYGNPMGTHGGPCIIIIIFIIIIIITDKCMFLPSLKNVRFFAHHKGNPKIVVTHKFD